MTHIIRMRNNNISLKWPELLIIIGFFICHMLIILFVVKVFCWLIFQFVRWQRILLRTINYRLKLFANVLTNKFNLRSEILSISNRRPCWFNIIGWALCATLWWKQTFFTVSVPAGNVIKTILKCSFSLSFLTWYLGQYWIGIYRFFAAQKSQVHLFEIFHVFWSALRF